jgi:lipopolysaccharide export system protein LptA
MSYLLNSPTFTGPVTLSNGPLILSSNQGIQIPDGAPNVTTNKIYAIGGSLYFNGSQLAGGGGLTKGSGILDFGTTPGKQYVTLTITGQTGISSATSKIKAYLMAVATAEHNAIEHAIVPMKIVCGNIVDGVGFTIYASSEFTLTGTFNVYWEY